jgi:hypothetical protein
MDLDIKYFDPSTMPPTSVVLLIGKRGSGKSTIAEDLMSYQTGIGEGICVSPTDKLTGFWRKHIPPLFIHHEYSPTITEDFLAHQAAKWTRYKKECKAAGTQVEEGKIDPAFIIYDDCTYDKSFLKNKGTRELLMNGRHSNVFVLITCQYLMDITPDLRGQIDYVVMLKDNNRNNREKLFKYFAGVFPSLAAFDETIRCCTENREAMVIDNNTQSYNIEDVVSFYKAQPGLEYKLGTPEYWQFGTVNYASDDEGGEVGKDVYHAGMTKRDRERANAIKVNKKYPAIKAPEYKPAAPGGYATAYRDTTGPTVARAQPKKAPKKAPKKKKKTLVKKKKK